MKLGGLHVSPRLSNGKREAHLLWVYVGLQRCSKQFGLVGSDGSF